MYLLAEGLTDITWPQALVMVVTALVPVILAAIQYFEKKEAIRHRDVVIKGVEKANHLETKRLIKVEATDAGVGEALQKVVKQVTNGKEFKKGSGSYFWLIPFLIFLPIGCSHNLQRPYVEAMEKVRKVIEHDVKRGAYKVDAATAIILADWEVKNVLAFKVLIASEPKPLEVR